MGSGKSKDPYRGLVSKTPPKSSGRGRSRTPPPRGGAVATSLLGAFGGCGGCKACAGAGGSGAAAPPPGPLAAQAATAPAATAPAATAAPAAVEAPAGAVPPVAAVPAAARTPAARARAFTRVEARKEADESAMALAQFHRIEAPMLTGLPPACWSAVAYSCVLLCPCLGLSCGLHI